MLVPIKHLIWSLVFHLGLIFLLNFIGSLDQSIKKTFIVFGIHSRNPSFVSYKAIPKGTPFIDNRIKKSGRTSVKKNPAQRSSINKKKPTPKIVKQKKKNPVKPKKPLVNKKRSTTFQKTKVAKQIVSPRKPETLKTRSKQILSKPKPNKKTVSNKKIETKSTNPVKKDTQDKVLSKNEVSENKTIDFNLIGYCSNKELLVYQKHIQQEVERLWRPPLGVPKGTLCTVFFSLNSQGQVKNCKFMERSKVLIYDLSIMQVAKKFTFNKCLWGKQFKIDFRQ